MDRLVVTAKLRPGARDDAERLVQQGPPFDPAELGLTRHAVYLASDVVVFLFEGSAVERSVGDLVNDPVHSVAFSKWAPLTEGSPTLAHETYFWERV